MDEKRERKLMKRVKVKKNPLGRGVFARREFSAATVIGEITGEIMDADFESDYVMDLDGKAVLDPDKPFRFLNHSCEPNSHLLLWKTRRIDRRKVPRIWLQAIRDVDPGEELTIDYAWPADAAVRCLCGAKGCRGWVVHEQALGSLQT